MRKSALTAAVLAVGGIATVAYNLTPTIQETAPASTSPTQATNAVTPTATPDTSQTASATPTAPPTATQATSNTVKDGTYAGSVVNTRFGTVQVQAVIASGKITDVIASKLTDADRRSQMISSQAAPLLRQEVLTAQSAKVSIISGATYTSTAHLTSLQAALDNAGFKG